MPNARSTRVGFVVTRLASRPLCSALAIGALLTGCGSVRPLSASSASTPSTTAAVGATGQSLTGLGSPRKAIWYRSVGIYIPASWPVIDGAHFALGCSSIFAGQADRAFLGVSYQGAPSCPAHGPNWTPPPADGVWIGPGAADPPQVAPTTLPSGQVVYLSTDGSGSAVIGWYRGVSIQIGIGADPRLEQQMLDSITYNADAADSPVLGRCPPPDPTPPIMPTPTRLTSPKVLEGAGGQMSPEPQDVQPKVSAASVWAGLFHDFGAGGFAGPLEWNIYFGSYSAQTPATINADGSTTPQYQGVPAWLIRGTGVETPEGPCGMTVIAPYDATTGQAMGVETIG